MPRSYRTPDLVHYLKGGPPPTNRSDIYQLGLVFAEMFSGSNPQRPMKTGDFTEPIELDPFTIRGGLSQPIHDLIEPMLHPDPIQRPSAAELFPKSQDQFLESAKRSHAARRASGLMLFSRESTFSAEGARAIMLGIHQGE